MSLEPVGKNDWHLNDFHSLTPQLVRHLNLEAVAVGADCIQIDGLERAAPKAFVAASRISKRHAGNDFDVFGGALTQHQTAERPVNDADAIEVSRPEYQVCIFGS